MIMDSKKKKKKNYRFTIEFRHCWMNVRRLGREKKKNIQNKVNVLKKG